MNDFSNKRLLLVDDEPNILVPIEFLMKQQGFAVEKAYNGQEALDKMKNYTPDIIILDVMMPKMDGFEVAKQIRANEKFAATQIIFLTAKGTVHDKDTGYSAGGEAYLTKPFDNDELVSIVTEMAAYG